MFALALLLGQTWTLVKCHCSWKLIEKINGFSIKFSYEFSQLVYYLRDPSVATLFCLHLFMYSIIFIMCAYRKGIVLSNKQTGHGTDLKDLTDFLEVRVFFPCVNIQESVAGMSWGFTTQIFRWTHDVKALKTPIRFIYPKIPSSITLMLHHIEPFKCFSP